MTVTEQGDLLTDAHTTPETGPTPSGLIPTTQWKAETLQVVNWGGFEGRVRFSFALGATLITGSSGTGKSTLLDAYIALMMPSETPFNGASNDAVGGRARGDEQRNLLTYLRGKVDSTHGEDGRSIDKLLRGDNCATWGAVAMTFVNDLGGRYTVLRLYNVPASVQRSGDITMRMATVDDEIDLEVFDDHASHAFQPTQLKAAVAGLRTYTTYNEFANALYTRLGIGANGDGDKALRLLVRAQSGQQIRTVDELYKNLVLEKPATFEAADRAVESFDALDASYQEMRVAQDKADALATITERHQAYQDALDELAALDRAGVTSQHGQTPLTLWTLRTETELLDSAVDRNRADRETTAEKLRAASLDALTTKTELARAQREHQESGGGLLASLANDIEFAILERGKRQANRNRLDEAARPLGGAPDTADAFEALLVKAQEYLEVERPALLAQIDADRTEVHQRQAPLLSRKRDIEQDRASLEKRAGRVTRQMDEHRHAVAEASGIAVEDLPFVAELIDVRADQKEWRVAIETVLGARARHLLVTDEQFEHFSAAIEQTQLRGRLQFIKATRHLGDVSPADSRTVAGKLVFKDDSPYRGWVTRHVSESSANALCVEDSRELKAASGLAVLRSGQTRQGDRGAHGRASRDNVIGFSNEDVIAELAEEWEHVESQLRAIDTEKAALTSREDTLAAATNAYQAIRHYDWESVAVSDVEARIAALEERRQEILAADDQLRELQRQVELAEKANDEARTRQVLAKDAADRASDRHTRLCDRQDEVAAQLDELEANPDIELDDALAGRLRDDYEAAVSPQDPTDVDAFPGYLNRLCVRLQQAVESAKQAETSARKDLEVTFTQFQKRWEDPNRGVSVASYPDYADILASIEAGGLHKRRELWRERLTAWNGEDLVPLLGKMEDAVNDIADRLGPINDVLSKLPFGARHDRLKIRMRRLDNAEVNAFRKELQYLASGATQVLTETDLEIRFQRAHHFMNQLRVRTDPRALPGMQDRARMLDVRRHVHIIAERVSTTGEVLGSYTKLGGQSGGESQELIAFIIGAALRFRLGDEDRERPRFAPVFLDEGFIKSDSQFAGRAVRAWKGLGFQLIVGAPWDKVTALEGHMEQIVGVSKNDAGYSYVDPVRDAATMPDPQSSQ